MIVKLHDGWCLTDLQSIADWGSGGTPSRKQADYYGGDIPWVKTGDLGTRLLTSTSERITEAAVKNSSAKLFPKGSVAVAMYGATIGKTSILGIDATTNQACAVGNPIHNVTTSDFLYYFLLNEEDAFIKKGKGGAQPNISQQLIKEHQIQLPPLPEQKVIAEKLDSLLAQVKSTKARLESIPRILKQFRQSVLAAAVSGELTEDWRSSNFTTQISVDEISTYWNNQYRKDNKKYSVFLIKNKIHQDLPENWIKIYFGNVFDVYVGATPSRKEKSYWNGDIPWVSSAEVSFCRITDTAEKITELGLKKTSTNIHPKGTIMLAMIGQGKTRGQPAILDIDACHNQNTAAIRIPQEYIISEFVYYYLTFKYEETRTIGGGNNQQALNKKTVQTLEISLPPTKEQEEIVRRVEELFGFADKVAAQVKTAMESVNHLTQSILAQAFSGELTKDWREQNPDLISGENSAAALLERIKAEREKLKSGKKG